MSTVNFPAGRYGRRRGSRRRPRWLLPVVTGLAVLAGAAVAAFFAQQGPGQIATQVVRIDFSHAHQVTVTFDVSKPGGVPATCVVRARDANGAEISRATVPIPAGHAGDRTERVTYTLATSRKPNTGEVYGCSLGAKS